MSEKKHPCPDCFFCQWCSDTRCASCKGWDTKKKKTTKRCKSCGRKKG